MFVDEISKEKSSEKPENTMQSDEKTNSETDTIIDKSFDEDDGFVEKNAKDKEEIKENNRDKSKEKNKEKESKKLSAELKTVKEELAAMKKAKLEAEAALAEVKDKYLRLAAEYENYRRRSIKEREDAYRDAYGDALLKMLPMIDNFERAAQYTEPEKLADGVKLILRGLPDLYSSFGVEAYGEVGDVFDPTIHNAVMRSEDGTAEPGTITAVLQKGYKFGDKILRYASVVVAGE